MSPTVTTQGEYHLQQLQLAAEALPAVRNSLGFEPDFRAWRGRVQRALDGLFGQGHSYAGDFAALRFQASRIRDADLPAWDDSDTSQYYRDLDTTQLIARRGHR